MKSKFNLMMALLFGLTMSPVAYADEADDMDEATITVVDESETPEDVVKVIALPEQASPTAVEKSASGLETANNAKENGSDFGQQVAEDARNDNISDQVREDARAQGRSEARGDNASDKRHTPNH